jgi:hypothetical protein
MPGSQTHIINKQVLEIQLDGRENAFQIQNQIRVLLDSDIKSMLEALCSDAAGPDEIIQIDRLEIDIGTIIYPALNKEFAEKVYENLKTSLMERVNAIRLEEGLSGKADLIDIDKMIRGSPESAGGKPGDRQLSKLEYYLQLLHHFLQTGTLPWHQETPAPLSLEKIFSTLLHNASENISALLKHDMRRRRSRQRLIYQFPDRLLGKAVMLLKPLKHDSLEKWLRDLKTVGSVSSLLSIQNSPVRLAFWDRLLLKTQISRQGYLENDDIFWSFLDAVASVQADSYPAVFGLLKKTAEQLSLSGVNFESRLPEYINQRRRASDAQQLLEKNKTEFIESVENSREDLSQWDPTAAGQFSGQTKQGTVPTGQLKKPLTLIPNKRTVSEFDPMAFKFGSTFHQEQSNSSAAAVAEKIPTEPTVRLKEIPIENAGLVLLWPYFINLFQQFNLLKDNHFIDDESKAHGIHLLQYLATGQHEPAEYALPLNKILCGLCKPLFYIGQL